MVINEFPEEIYNIEVAEFIYKNWCDLSKNNKKIYIALSGGNTPIPILKMLSEKKLNWELFHFFMVDERKVATDHPESNYGNIQKVFFDKVRCNSYPMVTTVIHGVPRLSHGFPTVIPQLSHGYPARDPWVIPQLSHGYPTVIPRLSHSYPTVIPRLSHGYPTRDPRVIPQLSMVVPQLSTVIPQLSTVIHPRWFFETSSDAVRD